MSFMPTDQPSPIILFWLQTQQMTTPQSNARPIQPGIGTFVTPPVPLLIFQLDQYQALHQDRAHQPERGPHKTAASSHNHVTRTSFSTITDDQRAISHHNRVGDINNARSGSVRRPPSSGMSAMANQKSPALQNRSKRASTIRGKRKCDELLQYVVTIKDTEFGRPWKRHKRGDQPATIPTPVVSKCHIDKRARITNVDLLTMASHNLF